MSKGDHGEAHRWLRHNLGIEDYPQQDGARVIRPGRVVSTPKEASPPSLTPQRTLKPTMMRQLLDWLLGPPKW